MVAIDTNIAVAINNGRPRELAWGRAQASLYMPAPVLGELLFGAANSTNAAANRQRVLALRAVCHLLSVDEEAAEHSATVRLGLKAKGRPIPEDDIWIAAVCLRHNMPLATADAHFSYVAGLTVVTP